MTTAERVIDGDGVPVTALVRGSGGDDGAPLRVDAFLDAKLNPPAPRWKWVRRDRLVNSLDQATSERPLTLVAAPAGYGKTTVVAQWFGELATRGSAWVALDTADNDPVRLWTHIATALQRAGCSFSTDPATLVASHASDIIAQVLPGIINSITDVAEHVVLVLDDYHFIRTSACHEQISFLLDHLPELASVVILTRADPALRLGRMRAAGRLAEIRAEHLSFDREETSALLALESIELSETAVAELLDRTEGWPAGLYLAILSVVGRSDADAFIHEFRGDDRYIGDYLTEEVLSRHPDDVRDFILSVSLFDRFSAPLCDFVLQTAGSSAVLHDLERTNLFLVPLDAKRQWFRFHHLFAAVARSELEAEGSARLRALHDRGADWFSSHGYIDEAVRHAIAAGSVSRAARLVQANFMRYVDAGRAATVEDWLKLLWNSDVPANAAALVTAAWMALIRGDEDSLEALLGELEEVEDSNPLPDGTRSVESAVALIKGTGGYGGPVQMLTAARRAVELETDERSPWYGFANFTLGHAHYVGGDLTEAMAALVKAAYADHSFAIVRQFALSVMAMVAREQGDLVLSGRYAGEALAVVKAGSLGAIPQASITFTVIAESQASDGHVAAALSTMEETLVLRRRSPGLSPWPTIHHLLAIGRVLTAAGDLVRAEQLLDEAAQLMSRFPDGMATMRARLTAARTQLRRRGKFDHELEQLTTREVEVLRLLQGSSSLTQIGARLYLSRNTVKTHAQAVYRKLGASSRSEAVQIARRHSLL